MSTAYLNRRLAEALPMTMATFRQSDVWDRKGEVVAGALLEFMVGDPIEQAIAPMMAIGNFRLV